MTTQTSSPTPRKPLRLWPGVAIVTLVALFKYVVPVVAPDANLFGMPAGIFGMLAGMFGGLAVVLWWLLLSRAAWFERLGAVALMVAGLYATPYILHVSIASGGMGKLYQMLAIPGLSLAFVAWAVATHRLPDPTRRLTMVATILLACGAWALTRVGGLSGEFEADLAWRWSKSPEERLLTQAGHEPAPPPGPAPLPSPAPAELPPAAPAAEAPAPKPVAQPSAEPKAPPPAPAPPETPAEWPGFRGPERNSIVRNARIATDWSATPPVEMWRRPVGPGWSSFAVQGDLFYTQEQRGQDEVVGCYRLSTGEPVWRHRDKARFWETVGGAGPRGTPTLSGGRVYTFGATGILNALDARTGAVAWTRNAAADTKAKDPGWGFCSSPLVVGDLLIVATSGTLAAYDRATGQPRWVGPRRRSDYSSPHLLSIDGVTQVVLLNGSGATSVAPADGQVLWEHSMPPASRIVQPALISGGDLLVSDGQFGAGNQMRRISVSRGPAKWTVEERWVSRALKPNFNDYVVHRGHAFGFDGAILACLDVADGQRKWKGGRYGNGQLVLLPDQDVLLVLSEEGELALVRATPDQFTELARFPAIQGKTWNHPVLVGSVLLVRNGEEMAAFRLAQANP